MTLADRLRERALDLPPVAAPVADYVPAVIIGQTVQTSGQLPFLDGSLLATGKVGEGSGLVPPERAAEFARTAALNALAAASQACGGPDRIASIAKVTVYVASDPAFTGQAAVANGASELLGELFDDPHARAAVGVAVLPLDSPVEVEILARLT